MRPILFVIDFASASALILLISTMRPRTDETTLFAITVSKGFGRQCIYSLQRRSQKRTKFGICGVNLSTNVEHVNYVVSVARYAEELGYHTAWLSDRLRDTYVNLTACAMATSKIGLARGMVDPFTRRERPRKSSRR